MSELDVIRAYYEKVVTADFPHALKPEDGEARLKAVTVRGCHGNSTNLLFFSVETDEGVIRRIAYDCQYCDITMYVTAELICELAVDQPVHSLKAVTETDIVTALGGTSKKVLRQANTSIGMLCDGLQG